MLAAVGIATVASASEVEKRPVKPTLAIDCSGHVQAVLDCCRAVRKGGEVALIGVPWRRLTELYAHEILDAVFHNNVHLRSGWEWELPRQDQELHFGSIHANLAGAPRWLADGRISVASLSEARRPTDCAGVYDDLANGRTKSLAVVFDWR